MSGTVQVLIIRTAGTNCDRETQSAFELAGARVAVRHVNELTGARRVFDDVQIIALPGGFTYGDDIAAGKILANELRMRLQEPLRRFLERNGLIIGICNGFQALVKMGMLPGNADWTQEVTLAGNDSGLFEARWVYLRRFPGARCVWTRGIENLLYLPVAHGEGKFIARNPQCIQRLAGAGQLVLRYCTRAGEVTGYPGNPNGSQEHVAGICDETGRVFGLMPHPERFVLTTQHPHWTRLNGRRPADGLAVFQAGVQYVRQS
ncbi:MAG: phosphoribosylformylglycinamidine synthase I [Candidatus Omnitrophica bacterium]|nr:phosphoribosylformylglycinamidine synthase I [Candidatus Omnitrophota bacterium]